MCSDPDDEAHPADNHFDEDEVKILLLGNATEIERAVELLHRVKRKHIWRIIRNWGPELNIPDIEDTYQDTMMKLVAAVRGGKFDANQGLLAYIATIARNLINDRRRRRDVRAKHRDEALRTTAGRPGESETEAGWPDMDLNERNRVNRIVRKTVASLPTVQRQVAAVWCDLFTGEASWAEIAQEVRRRSGCNMNVVRAQSAWGEAKRKLQEALSREGVTVGQGVRT